MKHNMKRGEVININIERRLKFKSYIFMFLIKKMRLLLNKLV